RGVAFDFRTKAITKHRPKWDLSFKIGSILMALAQGYMLGRYVMGFAYTWEAYLFFCISALCVTATYAFIGDAWLILKSEGELQISTAKLTRKMAWLSAFGIFLVSVVN